jgi:hypothetical protein
MTRPDEIAALANEDELADFIYQVQDYSHAKRKAAMLWPLVRLSATSPGDGARDVLHEFDVHQYVSDYEFRADQDYKPNEHEQAILEDAINGVISGIEAALAPAEKAGNGLTLPALPDEDADFTPELARKICGRYQEIIRRLAATPTPPSADVARQTIEACRLAIEYSMDMGCSDPACVLLQALNKCDAFLAQSAAPGGGTEGWTGNKCPACKGTGENLSNPMQAGRCNECGGTGDEYRHNAPSAPAQEPQAVAPFGYLFAKAGENGYYFVGPPEFASVESRFQHIYTPVYTRPVSLDREALALEAALNKIPSDLYWLIGKGKTRPDEPLYACQILNPATGAELACAENDDLITAITDAIIALIEGRT